MEKAFRVQLSSYLPILKNLGIKFKEDAKSLMVGKISLQSKFAIIISCRTLDTPDLLKKVLPILKNSKVAYRLIKDQHTQYRLNAGSFGDEEVGKVMIIFPEDEDLAYTLSKFLTDVTRMYKGPVVINAQQIASILYVQEISRDKSGEITLSLPSKKILKYEIPPEYRIRNKPRKFIGQYYLPVQLLRSSPKGNIYKAINLRKLAFNWCFVKQGNPVALDDHFDRDMKDRLNWQRDVLNQLANTVKTPKVVDQFQQFGYNYLVLEFADGESLGRMIRDRLAGKQWNELNSKVRIEILRWYLEAIEIVRIIHQHGFVHRDITDSNFIVLKDNSLCIIDFELSYSMHLQQPNPPFILGTFGYVAPEQIEHAVPDFKEDIYSLGALLCFALTACKTWEFIVPNKHQLKSKLIQLTEDNELVDLIIKCLSPSRADRPDLLDVRERINNKIIQIKIPADETITMAL